MIGLMKYKYKTKTLLSFLLLQESIPSVRMWCDHIVGRQEARNVLAVVIKSAWFALMNNQRRRRSNSSWKRSRRRSLRWRRSGRWSRRSKRVARRRWRWCVAIKSAWLALRVDARLYQGKLLFIKINIGIEGVWIERVCALIIYFWFGECSQQSVVCAAEEN